MTDEERERERESEWMRQVEKGLNNLHFRPEGDIMTRREKRLPKNVRFPLSLTLSHSPLSLSFTSSYSFSPLSSLFEGCAIFAAAVLEHLRSPFLCSVSRENSTRQRNEWERKSTIERRGEKRKKERRGRKSKVAAHLQPLSKDFFLGTEERRDLSHLDGVFKFLTSLLFLLLSSFSFSPYALPPLERILHLQWWFPNKL